MSRNPVYLIFLHTVVSVLPCNGVETIIEVAWLSLFANGGCLNGIIKAEFLFAHRKAWICDTGRAGFARQT